MNTSEPIDAQVVDPQTQALAIRPTESVGLFGSVGPVQVIEKATTVASALKDVLKKQGLISTISGKEYPKCEAWTLLGTMLGVFPVLAWCRQVDGGWEARVEAKTKDGATIGAAEAECLRSEKNWQNREDFALRSMAQTRATAKCLRMPLGFVMTLAGYEATPAEEMTFDHPKKPVKDTKAPTQPPAPKSTPTPAQTPARPRLATDATRTWMIEQLKAKNGQENAKSALEYFQKIDQLLPTETLTDLPLRFVPVNKEQMAALLNCVENFAAGGDAVRAFEPNPDHPDDLPKEPQPLSKTDAKDQPWYGFIVPIPPKGMKRDVYLKHPETIGGLYERRHGTDDESQAARQRLWGFVNHFAPKPWTKRDGTEMPPSDTDVKFREMLDLFADWFEKYHPDENL